MNVQELVARLRATERPMPEVTVEHRPAVPGWTLRAVATAATPLLLVLAAGRTDAAPGLVATVAVVLALWGAARPGPAPAYTTVFLAAAFLLGSKAAPFDPAVLWLAPLAHLTARLHWWASHVRARVRVELAALARTAARDAVVMVVTVALGGAAWAVSERSVGGLVALGAVALAALAWTMLRREDGAVPPAH